MATNPLDIFLEGKLSSLEAVTLQERPETTTLPTPVRDLDEFLGLEPEPSEADIRRRDVLTPPLEFEDIEQQPGLLRRGIGAVGGLAQDVALDLLSLPGRTLQTGRALVEGVGIGAELGLEALGLPEDVIDIQSSFTPEESRDTLIGSAIDAALFAIPVGRLAGTPARVVGRLAAGTALRAGLRPVVARGAARLGKQIVRGAAAFGKFEALTPEERNAASLTGRAGEAIEGAAFGAVTPVFGKLLRPIGRRGQQAIADAVGAVRNLFPKKAPAKILEGATASLEKQFVAAFEDQSAEQIIKTQLPKLIEPLAMELRGTLSAAGKAVEPELENIITRGTLGREAGRELGKIAKKEFPDVGNLFISENSNRGIKAAVATTGAALRAAGKKLEAAKLAGEVDPAVLENFKGFEKFYNIMVDQFTAQRRSSGRILRGFQEGVDRETAEFMAAHLERFGIALKNGQTILSIEGRTSFQRLVDQLKSGEVARAGRTFIRSIWRPGLFTATSFVADTFSNASRLIEKGGQSAIADIFDVVKGRTPVATEALFRGIAHSVRTRAPSVLNLTAYSEKLGVTFGRNLDRLLLPGALLKRAADTQFAKIGFFSSLYKDALKEAGRRGLQGAEKTGFVRRFVLESPDKAPEVLKRAIASANTLRFTDPLSKLEENIADSTAVQLLLTPFARFGFQFTRWMAEFTPLNPKFIGKVINNKATTKDFTEFVVKNMAGAGAVYFVDQAVYDNVDFETMEYVDPDNGERRSLSGFSPLPEILGINAIFRGEPDKALKAFERGSIGMFTQQGLITRMVSAVERIEKGADPRILADEFSNAIASAIPGKVFLGVLAEVFGAEPRTGLGRIIPGAGRPRIDPLTGEAARRQRFLFLGLPTGPGIRTNIPAPPILGSRLTERRLNKVERLFEENEVSTRFPNPVGLFNPATGEKFESTADIPRNLVDEFRREVGKQRGIILEQLFPNDKAVDIFRGFPKGQQERVLKRIKSEASRNARETLNQQILSTLLQRLQRRDVTARQPRP